MPHTCACFEPYSSHNPLGRAVYTTIRQTNNPHTCYEYTVNLLFANNLPTTDCKIKATLESATGQISTYKLKTQNGAE